MSNPRNSLMIINTTGDKSRYGLGAVWYQVISWANIDPMLCRYIMLLAYNESNNRNIGNDIMVSERRFDLTPSK